MRSVWHEIVMTRKGVSWRSTYKVEDDVTRNVVDPIIDIIGDGNEGFYRGVGYSGVVGLIYNDVFYQITASSLGVKINENSWH